MNFKEWGVDSFGNMFAFGKFCCPFPVRVCSVGPGVMNEPLDKICPICSSSFVSPFGLQGQNHLAALRRTEAHNQTAL